jgi:hypothetical protein
VSAPRALTATTQVPVCEGTPTHNDEFYPEAQLPLSCKLKDGTVLKSLVKPDHLELSIKRSGLRPATIRLPNEFAQLNRIVPVPGNEVVLIGMASGEIYEIVMVDTVNCRVVDHFWSYEPDVSPNGRLIAFVKWFPPHFVEDVTDVVMIYDLAHGASGNRPSGPGVDPEVDVGIRVYPPGTNTPGDNIGTELRAALLDSVLSQGFFWAPDSSKFLFADEHVIGTHQITKQDAKGQSRIGISTTVELRLVLVSMKASAEKPLVTVFTVRHCQTTCGQQLDSVEFAENGVKARFRYSNRKNESLEVKYAEFRAP